MSKKKYDSMKEMDKKIENAIIESGQETIHVIYSAYPEDEKDNPIDNLDEIAISGKAKLFRKYNEDNALKKAEGYLSEVVENPNWLQLCVLANAAIKQTKDFHHVFFDGVENTGQVDDNGIPIYRLILGS